MREHEIRTAPIEFLDILGLRIEEEINRHGRMVIAGHIADEEEEEYTWMLSGELWEQVQAVSADGEIRILFNGIITGYSITRINDQKKLTLEVMTGSSLLDEKTHLRSFQDPSMDYEGIFRKITEEYAEAGVIFAEPFQEATGGLVLQYHETEWEFLKRLASRKNQFLVPASYVKGEKFFYGLPEGEEFRIAEGAKYRMGKNLGEYRRKAGQGMAVSEADFLEYMIEDREHHRIGDYAMLYGRKFSIYRMESRYEGGELLHCCYLRREKGMKVPEIWKEKMTGCTLDAKVVNVKEDKVQVSVAGDENAGQEAKVWYPYATVYSAPDGTGWYCMPEPGDEVRLTVPEKREADAFVSSSVHMETDSEDRKNPEHKVLKSKYQKEVRFTPDSIVITNHQGTRIELTDAEGIHIVSAHSVMLEAAEDVTIASETGSLLVAGSSMVNLKQKGTSLQLDNSISFIGGELKIQ